MRGAELAGKVNDAVAELMSGGLGGKGRVGRI